MGDKTTLYTAPPANRVGPQSPKTTLIEAVCAKELKKECKEWIDWFHNQKVPNEAKLNQLHYRNSEGYSVLHYAALHYRPDILSMALEITGADFNLKTRDGLTPLLVAVKNNRKNTILWLLQDGCECVDVCAVDDQRRNAIHLAALNLQCQYAIEPLVRQLGDQLCFQQDKDGNTPLHLAAQIGNMQAIENGLLSPEIWNEDDDSDEEEEDSEDEVPREDVDTEMKKMIRVQNRKKQTALHVAVENGHSLVVKKIVSVYPEALLIGDKNDNLPILLACKSGKSDVVKELLQATVEHKSAMPTFKLRKMVLESLERSNLDQVETKTLVKQLAKRNRVVAGLLRELHIH